MALTGTVPFKLYRPLAMSASGDGCYEATIADTLTLDYTYEQDIILDGGAANRDVVLPAEDPDWKGVFYWVRNKGATNNLVIKDDGGNTIATVEPSESAKVISNGSAWKLVALETGGAITDTHGYYTVDTTSGATDELALQIGGLTSGTFNFTEDNVVADNDAVYAAIDKLDLKWGDLASTANTEGASLVGLEDAGGYFTATNVEQVADELYEKSGKLVIADPGTGNPIPVVNSSTIALTIGAAGETNSLAAPSFRGQTISLYADTVGGGNRVITSAVSINQVTNTIMTFTGARDFIKLEAIYTGGALVWQVTANDGVALS